MTSRRSMSTLAVLGLLTVAAAAQGGAAAAPGTTEPAPTPTESGGTETTCSHRRGAVRGSDHHRRADVVDRTVHAVGCAGARRHAARRRRAQRRRRRRRPAARVAGGRRRVEPRGGRERHRAARSRRAPSPSAAIISSDVGLATARVAEELETPMFLVKAGSEADPHPGQPLHVPHVPPVGADGRRADRPVRRGGGADQGRSHRRRLRLGAGVPGRAGGRRSPTSRASSCRSRWRRCPSRTSRRTCATSRRSSPISSWPPAIRRDPGRSPCSRRISASTSR